jgi:hypothetical protein
MPGGRFQAASDATRSEVVSLAPLIDRVPSGKQWIHENKFDGYEPLQFGDCQCSHTRSAPLKTIGDTPKAIAPQNKVSLKTSRLRCMAVPFHLRRLVKD